MVATDEDALVCDFAETYHIYDFWGLPPSLAATLAAGLGPESRIGRKRMGIPVRLETLLLSMAVDRLSILAWLNSKDGQDGTNRPDPITPVLIGREKTEREYVVFDDAEAFEAERKRILEGL